MGTHTSSSVQRRLTGREAHHDVLTVMLGEQRVRRAHEALTCGPGRACWTNSVRDRSRWSATHIVTPAVFTELRR